LLYRKRFCCPASAFPVSFLSSIFYANFEANHNLYVVHHNV